MNARIIGFAALTAIAAVIAFFALREFQSDSDTGFEKPSVARNEDAAGPRGPARALDLEALRADRETAEAAGVGPDTTEDEGDAVGAILTGRLVGEDGLPLPDVDVSLTRTDGEVVVAGGMRIPRRPGQVLNVKKTRSDAEGRFRFSALKVRSRHLLGAIDGRHIPLQKSIEIEELGERDLGDLVLKEGGSIAGRVLSKGLPVANVLVSAEPATPEGRFVFRGFAPDLEAGVKRPHAVRTDTEGQFEIGGLRAGDWDLLTDHSDYQAMARRGIELAERAHETGITIEISAGLTIRGRVLDEAGAPLAGVQVRAVDRPMLGQGASFVMSGDRKARSDELGAFEIGGLLPREYTLRASAEGYMDRSVSGRPGADEIELRLPPSAVVFGLVRDARSGEPIENTRISPSFSFGFFQSAQRFNVLGGEAAAAVSALDEHRGLYAIADLNKGGIQLDIDAPGYGRVRSRALTVAPGEKLRFDIALEPEARIDGRVVDPDGKPVAGAEVSFERPGGTMMQFNLGSHGESRADRPDLEARNPEPAMTDAQGRFSFSRLAHGDYHLQARAAGFSPSTTVAIALASAAREEVEVSLRPGSAIVGQALDARGNALARALVSLETLEQGSPGVPAPGDGSKSTRTDDEGRFEFPDLEPGAWRVAMNENAGGLTFRFNDPNIGVHRDVQLPEGETVEVILSLEPRASISGQVTAAGKPVEGATVEVGDSNGFFGTAGPSATTDSDGRFRIEGVGAGPQKLTVKAKGAPIPTRVELEVTEAIDNRCDVELPGGAIEGRLVSADTGKALAGMDVEAREVDADGSTRARTAMAISFSPAGGGEIEVIEGGHGRVLTDAQGRYHMPFLPDGDYLVSVKGGGYRRETRKPIEVRDGRITRDVDFSLEPGYRLDVEIGTENKGFAMIVVASIDDGPKFSESKVARNGKTSFAGLRAGLYAVSVQSFGSDGDSGGNGLREVRIRNSDESVRIDLK